MKENRILLFGDTGQVGYELLKRLPAKEAYLGKLHVAKTNFLDKEAVLACIDKLKPSVIINAAAYTDVEKAEEDSTTCYAVNAYGPQLLAQAAKKIGATLIHYSTDYVFSDSVKNDAYKPSDKTTEPLNVYGRSKLLGELLIQESGCSHIILRTSWIFSSRRKNFVKTMLRMIASKREAPLTVISNQYGSPTSANELARQTIAILERVGGEYSNLSHYSGIYHLTCQGFCSWFTFTKEIIRQAKENDLPVLTEEVLPIRAQEYTGSKVKRPRNSRLECYFFEVTFQTKLKGWKASLTEVLTEEKIDYERNQLRSVSGNQGSGIA